MDTILDILYTANQWMFTVLIVLALLGLLYYLYSTDKVMKKYESTFYSLSAKALIEKIEDLDAKGDKMKELEKFHSKVTNIRHSERCYPYITCQCRKLQKEYINIKSIYIDGSISEKQGPNTSRKYSQRDIVFALQTVRDCNEHPFEISRANTEHLTDIFGGKADSYKKHFSPKLRSDYEGQDDEINKLFKVIDCLAEQFPSQSFDNTKQMLEELRAARK